MIGSDILNNRGFTLIELVIIIAVLGMITLISAPNIIKLLNKNKVDNYNNTIDSIIEATELYVSNNRYNLNFNGNCTPKDTKDISTNITLKNLIDSKDITSPVINPCNDNSISDTTKIKVTLSCKTRQFSYDIVYDSSTTLTTKTNVTDSVGKILSGKTCEDLY